MSDEIIKIIDAIANKFGVVIDWGAANVMPYLEDLAVRFIGYEIAASIYIASVLLAVTIIGAVVTCVLYPHAKAVRFHDEATITWVYGISVAVTVLLFVIFCITTCVQGYDVLSCLTMPEKVIFEYLRDLSLGIV